MRIDKLHNPTVYGTYEQAERIAQANEADDEDGWTYEVVQIFNRMYAIQVRDNEGDLGNVLGLL